MGVAGSGKTTVGSLLAHRLGWQFADADGFHPKENVDKMSRGEPLTDADRAPWLEAMAAAIRNWLSEKRPVVLACSALKSTYRATLRIDSARVAFVYLHGDATTLEARLKHRVGHFMSASMLSSQLATLEEPHDALTVDVGKEPQAIVEEIVASLRLDG
jgi:gluconokinase